MAKRLHAGQQAELIPRGHGTKGDRKRPGFTAHIFVVIFVVEEARRT
jgi:hypothetical protein